MNPMDEIAFEQQEDGTWIAYRDGEIPDRDGDGWERNGLSITGRGKTPAEAEVSYINQWSDYYFDPPEPDLHPWD